MNFYEYDADVYDDSELPVFFSSAVLEHNEESAFLHWHEATELLFCTEGSGIAVSDTLKIPIKAGELAVINPNRLHTFYAPVQLFFSVSPSDRRPGYAQKGDTALYRGSGNRPAASGDPWGAGREASLLPGGGLREAFPFLAQNRLLHFSGNLI